MRSIFTPLSELMTCQRADDLLVAISGEEKIYWGAFRDAVSVLARQLQVCGQQRWLLCDQNSYCFAVGFMALLHAGKTVVLPPNTQPGTLQELVNTVGGIVGDISEDCVDIPVLSHRIGGRADFQFTPLSAKNLSIEVLTSGSTGKAKVIPRCLEHFEEELKNLNMLWDEHLRDTLVFATVSHQHIYGLLFRLLWPLSSARPFNANSHQYPEQLFGDIERYCSLKKQGISEARRAVLISSPAHLERIPDSIDLEALAGNISAIFSSGGPLAVGSAVGLKRRLGIVPIEIFGSSETGGVAYRSQQSLDTDEPWKPFLSVALRSSPETALLQVSSPFVYSNGWFEMGDRVEFINPEMFHLRGRVDRIVKLEEKRLSLDQMERYIKDCDCVEMVRVLTLPGRRTLLAAIVVLSSKGAQVLENLGKRALNELIRTHLLQHFESVLLPRKWRYVERIPVNSQGKFVLPDLQALFIPPAKLNPLSTILHHQDSDCVVLVVDLPADHDVFVGHFPGLPILPGVVQLDLAIRQAQCYFYQGYNFTHASKLKFKAVIRPQLNLKLILKDLGGGKITFSYSQGDKELSCGQIYMVA